MKRALYAIIALSSVAFVPTQATAQVGLGLNVVIGNAPPPPRFESVPPARSGYVWAPGYWNWEGNRHAWAAGHWEAIREGQQYQRSQWVQENNSWRLNRGGWVSVQQPVAVDYVRLAPPRPRFERVPHARPGYVWATGHWEWRGQGHDWVPGVWIAERPGYLYSPAYWAQRDGRWYMEQGRWAPRGGDERDHDHDRNHYDHDRDNGGSRHDRDGDGLQNGRDNYPDNPRHD